MPQPTSKRSRSASASLALAVALASSTVSGFAPAGTRIRTPSRLFNEEESAASAASLFEDFSSGENSTTTPLFTDAQFGESVPLKKASSSTTTASFGESVPLKRPNSANNDKVETDMTALFQAKKEEVVEQPDALKNMRSRNLAVAVASVVFAIGSYAWQFTHPITPVQLLATMQSNSAPLTTIGTNGKPTVVDFWAPWCENCKMAAPTLQKLEEEYKDQVNFVMINGDRPEAWPLIERFGVDAIPHMALISAEGDVETALIGPIPKRVLKADLDTLLDNANSYAAEETSINTASEEGAGVVKKELPYKMLDAFANAPEYRRIKFQMKEQ